MDKTLLDIAARSREAEVKRMRDAEWREALSEVCWDCLVAPWHHVEFPVCAECGTQLRELLATER